ncbi:pC84L [African swine fever virus]|nr:pC84L [African swine fever virus]YP_009702311.1 pC84L [African swine fever virus]YP_009702469.1 pC84L [African swine fever virus]YP_009702630.1 pC84L [African swine fever virus]YP_009703119.1 C84L [African swine fever virus]YP_009703308.1 pC84L [African swine fever virus]YP_009703516.1 pC84L [African swine fever virus Benin 97/1]YP_009703671.1 pC84L [African swine fever virus OURT 88/3]YP_009703832.1 hypothetical protein F8224_gp070 [African swine fever virus E75]AAA65293.1 pC84L [Afric
MLLFIWIRNNFSISYIPLIYSLLQKTTKKKENRFFIRSGKKIQRIQMMMFITVYDINQKQKKRYGLRGCNLNLKATVLLLHKRI